MTRNLPPGVRVIRTQLVDEFLVARFTGFDFEAHSRRDEGRAGTLTAPATGGGEPIVQRSVG